MVRGLSAAWLLVALAAAWSLCARAEEPLRMPELVLRPASSRAEMAQRADGSFTLPGAESRVRSVSHLDDDGELAPIVSAAEKPVPIAPQPEREPPKMLPG